MSRDYAKRFRNRSALKAAQPAKPKRSGVLAGPGFGDCGFSIEPVSHSALLSGDGISAIAAVSAFNSIALRKQAKAREARRLAALPANSHVIEKAAPTAIRSGPVVVTGGD